MSHPLLIPTLEAPYTQGEGEMPLNVFTGHTAFYAPGRYVRWVAGMDEDDDGSGSSHGDTYHQDRTSFMPGGKSLDADRDVYIVISQAIMRLFPERTIGRPAEVYNLFTRKWVRGVVGDAGPFHKCGEASLACSRALGINSDPVKGGESRHVVSYVVYLSDPVTWGFPQASQGHNG